MAMCKNKNKEYMNVNSKQTTSLIKIHSQKHYYLVYQTWTGILKAKSQMYIISFWTIYS